MPTNVTQKDETLKQVIDWCKQFSKAAQDATAISNRKGRFDTGAWHHGRMTAFNEIEQHCESMLGYGGSMPLEVPNQSEDAK